MKDNNESSATLKTSTDLWWAAWSIGAAFGTYFCMYGLRKPFTAASFSDNVDLNADGWTVTFKVILVTAQTMGYMLSKFIGIKVISEMPPHRRAAVILALCTAAEVSLLLFAVLPRPWSAVCLFLNGLPLGMVFGLVLGFLEGRRLTELLTAGLCFSFIFADGVVKAVGKWLLDHSVSETWMPAAAGGLFLLPLAVGAWMLSLIPPPSTADQNARAVRDTMTSRERRQLYLNYAFGLTCLVIMYFLVTVVRSVRSDFAKEIWSAFGTEDVPALYAWSEMLVGIGSCSTVAALVLVKNNRTAYFAALGLCLIGLLTVVGTLTVHSRAAMPASVFMIAVGLGLYLPYVAVHTTLFERFLAITREKGTISFLMYVADAIGYLGYVAVILTPRSWITGSETTADPRSFLSYFIIVCWICSVSGLACTLGAIAYFQLRIPYHRRSTD
ncbi:MAG: DUF5690 family protein [Pirellulales bacterium]